MRKITTIVGARPQFIKAAALSWAFRRHGGFSESLVHTGQHYDPDLSDVFFRELDIPAPRHHLNVGSGAHGAMTGEMLKRIEEVLLADRPDAVLVYGDTNSTLAGALAAAKLQLPFAHVEAGLRSFNRAMPEELNRVVTDHLSRWLFCPTRVAVQHLAREGIERGVSMVGDVMHDVAKQVAERARTHSTFAGTRAPKSFVLATIHRAENTDDPARLGNVVWALEQLAARVDVLLPLHPRTKKALTTAGISTSRLTVLDPVGLVDMTWLEANARLIVTDSGGVQKEAYFQRTPCLTLRTETEWVETVEAGWNTLADPRDRQLLERGLAEATQDRARHEIPDYGTGEAAATIVGILERALT